MTTVYKFGGSPEFDKEEEEIINKMSNDFILRDGGNRFMGTLDMGINKISRVVDPIDSQDVATKKYVDDVRKQTIKLIRHPRKKLLVSTEDGNAEDTGVAVEDLVLKSSIADVAIPKLESPTGDKYLVSTSDGKVVESPKRYTIEYSSITPSSGITSDSIRIKGQNISKLSLSAGLYRVTTNCTLEKFSNVHDHVLQGYVWVCIYDKGKRNDQLKRRIFRVLAFDIANKHIITQTTITRIPNIKNAKIRIFKDSAAVTALTRQQSCDFILEKLE